MRRTRLAQRLCLETLAMSPSNRMDLMTMMRTRLSATRRVLPSAKCIRCATSQVSCRRAMPLFSSFLLLHLTGRGTTDRKILDMLPNRPPQVTFTCDVSSASCGFQFWIGSVESFFCGLNNCTTRHEVGYEQSSTEYTCQQMSCSCIPGRMLCGEDGSVGE